MSAGQPLLDVRGLVVRYGSITAVRGLDLWVERDEIVAIVGPNGAGKTSLLSAVAGIVRPSGGSIAIAGRPTAAVAQPDIVRCGAALVPEGRNIFGSLTVLENLRLGATIRRDGEVAADIGEVFSTFPILGRRRDQPAGQLSGGEQQMLAIARAMLSRPRLLMLDEPSLGLAPTVVDQVDALLRSIRERGIAILVVEQNAARAFAIADRAHIMNHGAFTLAGTPAGIAGDGGFDAAYFGFAMTPAGTPA